jgi:hypothetical protein
MEFTFPLADNKANVTLGGAWRLILADSRFRGNDMFQDAQIQRAVIAREAGLERHPRARGGAG